MMRKTAILLAACLCLCVHAHAQRNTGRVSLGAGLLYRNGMDVILAYEHETNYHNAWEFFANGYLQWVECPDCGHICPDSFWRNYRTYGFGVAYKPCVMRGATISATYVSGHLQAVTRKNSLAASTSATNTTTCCGRAGYSSGR